MEINKRTPPIRGILEINKRTPKFLDSHFLLTNKRPPNGSVKGGASIYLWPVLFRPKIEMSTCRESSYGKSFI